MKERIRDPKNNEPDLRDKPESESHLEETKERKIGIFLYKC